MKKSIKMIEAGKILYKKYPVLRPPIKLFLKYVLRDKPITRFSGWGMTTVHELPWEDKYDGETFRKASIDIKTNLDFDETVVGYGSKNIDELLWRHWNISTAVRYSLKFSKTNEHHFVECGVGEGMTAFFALRELFEHKDQSNSFVMHLYDSWNVMKNEDLTKREINLVVSKGYQGLDINKTQKNLSEFNDFLIYHSGYIPESLHNSSQSPNSISYLHIDLNSVKATQDALNYFYPRLISGGVIIFDDYGAMQFVDTRRVIDQFFSDKPGILIKFPTGQAMYCNH